MESKVRKLPLWKTFSDELIEEGLEHGKVYSVDRFEAALSCDRNSREFGLGVHEIRCELERKGFYLQGHAMREGNLVLVPPEKHVVVVKGLQRRNQKNTRRGIALLSATDRKLLPAKLRPYHEKLLMRIQLKQLLDARSIRIGKFLEKKAPKMLEIHA